MAALGRPPSVVDEILASIAHLPVQTRILTSPSIPSHSVPRSDVGRAKSRQSSIPLLNISASATQDAKALFVTLHVLFPHELLPALDLLDKGLLNKLVPSVNQNQINPSASIDNHGGTNSGPSGVSTTVSNTFYVQSASALVETSHRGNVQGGGSGRFRDAMAAPRGRQKATQTYYEVRLDSWNCSCAAFAFSAFTCMMQEDEGHESQPEQDDNGDGIRGENREAGTDAEEVMGGRDGVLEDGGWKFGGTATRIGGGVPVCKHILAAFLARAAPQMFQEGKNVKILEVGREEMAAWGAGWGDG